MNDLTESAKEQSAKFWEVGVGWRLAIFNMFCNLTGVDLWISRPDEIFSINANYTYTK